MSDDLKLIRLKQLQRRLFGAFLVILWFQSSVCWSINDEGLALLRFKERVVKDPFGALLNWRDDGGEINPCSWFGVECVEGKVVVLNLKDLSLEGTLASELGNLIHMKSIILRNNSFGGIIPDDVVAMKELEVLDLGYNNFTGPLPLDLGSNLSLIIVLLDNNERLGSYSSEINEIQKLSETQVDENQLSRFSKSSSKIIIARNTARAETTVQKRLLQEITPIDPPPPPMISFTDPPPPPMFSLTPPSIALAPNPPASSDPSINSPSPSPSPQPSFPTPPPPPPPPPSTAISPRVAAKRSSSKKKIAIVTGAIGAAILAALVIGLYLWKYNKVTVVKPWATGLSGQLQKAFVTGVPKLRRVELEAACEDFCNVIGSSPIGTIYKGTLSSGAEIAVASLAVQSAADWSRNLETQFRKKIDTLSKVNHKNFVNLIGYCEEDDYPFTRMLVFEYAPNGTLFEHLHIKESEHLNWGMRLRIAMGMAYCLEHMHQLSPPVVHNNICSSSIYLTEDYAAKVSDLSFCPETAAAAETSNKLLHIPSASLESNVYSFGVLLFEMVTGKMPFSADTGSFRDWAAYYMQGMQTLVRMVDPTLNSFDETQLVRIEEMIRTCVNPDPRQRPTMREVTGMLREITSIPPDGAIPRISPLWWAELEILSGEAN